jgi:hypothetical protein
MIGKIAFWAFVVGCITFAGGLTWFIIQEAIAVKVSPAGIAMVVGALMILWSIILGMLLAK